MSSLGYVGSVLDKFGGRAVRGSLDALMGHGGSREILSLIPFSDTLGITDPAAIETHRGAQLLKHGLGYDPEQAHGHWGAWAERNLLGPAVEIGLDPATWAGGVGALTKAGRAAAKLGKVPGIFRPGYLGALERGERTLVHGIRGKPAVAIAQGAMRGTEAATEAANQLLRRSPRISRAMDVAGEWARETAIPGVQSLIEPLGGWSVKRGVRAAIRAVKSPQMDKLERALVEQQGHMRLVEGPLKEQLVKAGHDPEKLDIWFNQAREGVTDPRYVDQALSASLPPEAHALADRMREVGQQLPQIREAGAGLETRALKDIVRYAHRVRNPIYDLNAPAAERAAATQAKLLKTTHQAQLERLKGTTGYAGGTEELQSYIAQHGGKPVADIVPQMKEAIAGRMKLPVGTQFSVLPGSEQERWVREAAGFLSSVKPQQLINPVTKKVEPYFVRDPIQMTLRRGMLGAEATTSARTITHALTNLAQPLEAFGPDAAKVGVADVLKRARMHTPQALRTVAEGLGYTAEDIAAHAHESGGLEAAQRAMQAGAEGTAPRMVAGLGGVPAEVGQDLGLGQRALRATMNAPREVGEDLATAALRATRGVDLGAIGKRAFQQGVRRPGARQGMFPGELGADVATEAARAAPDLATAALKAQRGVKLGAASGAADEMRALRSLLNQHAVDAGTARELTELLSRGGPPPHELKWLERVGQKVLRPTKNALYTIWMSSHVRNANTGKLQALVEAGVHPLSKAYKLGRALLRNPREALDLGIAGVKDAQQLMIEAFADRIIDTHAGELAAQMPEGLNVHRFAKDPFTPRPGLAKAYDEFKNRVKTGPWANPIGEKGAAVQAGHAVNTIVENELRLGQYIDMRQRGFTREMARERVMKTHFDYERGMTPMMRRILGNAMVFPTFTYHNVPKQFGLAAMHPARISGPLRFAGGGMGDEENYVPRYLQGGLNFPVPATGLPEGTRRFLTSLGTPMEEAFGHLKVGGSAVSNLQRTGVDIASMARPDVKALAEFIFGHQLHTNRPLSQLDAGRLAALAPFLGDDAVTLMAQVASGSPLSRVGSTLGMLTDPRKATWGGTGMSLARLMTGVKSSDVDVEKQKGYDETAMLKERLGRSRNIHEGSYFYVPKANQPYLTDEEERFMRLFSSIQKRSRERSAQQKNAQFGNP